ncbi:unnamed protein product, partial [Amoebophrya sp. A120]
STSSTSAGVGIKNASTTSSYADQHEVDLILCDEATANIDLETDRKIHDLILNQLDGILGRKTTVIWIMHRLEFVSQFDQVLIMDKGRIVHDIKQDVKNRRKKHLATNKNRSGDEDHGDVVLASAAEPGGSTTSRSLESKEEVEQQQQSLREILSKVYGDQSASVAGATVSAA